MGSSTKTDAPAGRRRTRQREVIADVIAGAEGPLTAPEILHHAQGTLPGLGIATVYRTLGLLQESGDVCAVVMPNGDSRYESARIGHHHHFQCRICNRVFDLHGCTLPPAASSVPAGFRVESHEITYQGVCPDCPP